MSNDVVYAFTSKGRKEKCGNKGINCVRHPVHILGGKNAANTPWFGNGAIANSIANEDLTLDTCSHAGCENYVKPQILGMEGQSQLCPLHYYNNTEADASQESANFTWEDMQKIPNSIELYRANLNSDEVIVRKVGDEYQVKTERVVTIYDNTLTPEEYALREKAMLGEMKDVEITRNKEDIGGAGNPEDYEIVNRAYGWTPLTSDEVVAWKEILKFKDNK